jgi:alkanesulfonate monooxygenase SsuD/methylene tetrahydromethanopterin reductase-like flavin-dependent oxidoreductase (luciferase family)
MNFGLILTGENPKPWQVPSAQLYRSMLQQAVLAEELGYDSVWTAEHHGTDEYWPAQFPVLAAIAARTSRIRVGTYIVILPLYHPLQVAEEAATLDALSDGRFDLGVGQGYVVDEYAAYNISRRERPARMEEGLAILRGVWEQEGFSFAGKHYNVAPFSLRPRPVQPRLPIWVAGRTEKAVDRAARYGCHLAGAGSAAAVQLYDACLRRHGRDPQDFYRATLRLVYLSDTRERAWEECAPHALHRMKVYTEKLNEAGDDRQVGTGGYFGVNPLPAPEGLRTAQGLHFFGAPLIVGTPEGAIQEITRSRDEAGVTHLVMWMQIGGIDPRRAEHSMRLFAREVIPHFRAGL